MKIHYVINQWGHYMPIFFDRCCDTMTMLFSPESKPTKGFWFDNTDGQLKEYNNGKIVGRVTSCWFCHKHIELIPRELKPQ
jgi:hypothetical protein